MGATVTTPGRVVAAPMVGEIFKKILLLMKVEQDFENQIDKEYRFYYDVPNLIGKTKKAITTPYNYNYIFIGNGDKVIDQEPKSSEKSQKVELLFCI